MCSIMHSSMVLVTVKLPCAKVQRQSLLHINTDCLDMCCHSNTVNFCVANTFNMGEICVGEVCEAYLLDY